MGLLEQEIAELRNLASEVLKGSIDTEKARTLTGIYAQSAKRENLLVQMAITAEKHGGKDKMWKRLNDMNLIDDKSAIAIDGSDSFRCPEKGGLLVDRASCLDYSGESHNIDRCQKCEQFEVTRRRFNHG